MESVVEIIVRAMESSLRSQEPIPTELRGKRRFSFHLTDHEAKGDGEREQ
jgi:hypothetical protein